ncbi:MAG: FAD-dependent oxidoreductase [Coriobacteriaceae bacterium]|nr:FAD-dependent oxidoreductase [Coriobacteriaceae bacterium]MDD7111902.1 FAD-dependent oxidoreductase [Coriobacteriaceae bacterium]
MSNMSRRAFMGLGVAGAAAAAMPGLCYTAVAAEDATEATPSFLVKPAEVTEFAATHEYEVVIVGAGISGTSAALTAAREGLSVAVVQDREEPYSQGNMGAALDMERTSAAGRAALISKLIELSAHRADRALLEAWADNSTAALTQMREASSAGGVDVNEDEPDADRHLVVNGYDVYLRANTYFRIGHGEVVKAVAPAAQEAGAEYFFEMPAVQLAQDAEGRVTGVVCQNAEGAYELFSASKGVVLATGCYGNNAEMVNYYCPDLNGFYPYMVGKRGDGHKMGVWAGGRIEPIGHTKMVHDARVCRADAPYLLVNYKGERCLCEGPLQGYLNNYVRGYVKESGDALVGGNLFTVTDAKWRDQAAEWAQTNPEINIRTCVVYYEGNTLEEAVAAAAADGYSIDAEQLAATVERYNELAAKGEDDDFGKAAEYLCAIDEPPFVIVPHDFGLGLSAVLGGLVVDVDGHVLAAGDDMPVEGLYAVGNCAGGFYGGADYPMDVLGLSIGRAITDGYRVGKKLAE